MASYNSIVIDAPADKVWEKVRNFHDLSWAAGVIETCEAVGNIPATQIGAQRMLNGVFHETLHALDDLARTVRYSIDDGPDAVSKNNVQGYIGEVRVFPVSANNGSFVLWTSGWESSSGGVAEFCNPIYRALLAALKGSFA